MLTFTEFFQILEQVTSLNELFGLSKIIINLCDQTVKCFNHGALSADTYGEFSIIISENIVDDRLLTIENLNIYIMSDTAILLSR